MKFEYYFFIALVPSVVLHEVSHGWVANFFGDPTAKDAHRLTLNPLRHIDPFGTVLLPALMLISGLPAFGYAKPVPVNISRLRKPRQQSLYVSLAGPFVNIILSAIGLLICKFSVTTIGGALYVSNLTMFNIGEALGLVNLILAAFNLLPIPPLDGSAIIERFVPAKHLGTYYQFRARALPFVMVFVILGSFVFHFGNSALASLENWWIGLI
jgi:Zn-dependent protease